PRGRRQAARVLALLQRTATDGLVRNFQERRRPAAALLRARCRRRRVPSRHRTVHPLSRPRTLAVVKDRIVYSTHVGERCPNCQRPVRECICRRGTPGKTSSDGVVRVSRETQGRKGKGVTVVTGLGSRAIA